MAGDRRKLEVCIVIYNSQRVNNDPLPWKSDTGAMYPEAVYSKSLESASFEPRPEYDNDPNPILLEIREINEKYPGSNMETYEVNLMAMQSHGYAVEQSVPHTLHALKVLEKLVRVYGDDNE